MKKIIFMLALVLPMLVNAQKLGHINSQELLAAMPELKDMQAKLDTLAGQYEVQFANMQEEFNKKVAEFQQQQSTMTAGVREFRQQEIAEMEQRIYIFRETAQKDIQSKQQEFLMPIQKRMLEAIQKVGAEQGCTYVMDAMAMLYIAPDALDLMPLVKKDGLPEKAREIINSLKLDYNCQYDEKDSIGKRYRRQDAIGTPFCVTVDHQTLEDNTVTVRHRDTMEQERVSIDSLHEMIRKQVSNAELFKKLLD